jgi:hypothetical protein
MTRRLLWLTALGASTVACAGTATSQFAVRLEVRQPQTCINQALSEQTGALVQVVCQSGDFVRIDPDPRRPFVGTHGGAFRYAFMAAGAAGLAPATLDGLASDATLYAGSGTVTGLHVYNERGDDEQLEILITY